MFADDPLFLRHGATKRFPQVRSAVWHAVTFEEQRLQLRRMRAVGAVDGAQAVAGVGRLLKDPWKTNPGLVDLATPKLSTVRRFNEFLPGTAEAFEGPLWQALDPALTLARGRWLATGLEASSAGACLRSLTAGEPIDDCRPLGELSMVAVACLKLRLSITQQDGATLPNAAAVVHALCYLPLTSRYRHVAHLLGGFVEEALLAGAADDMRRYIGAGALGTILTQLAARAGALEVIAGVRPRASHSLAWPATVAMSRVLVATIARSVVESVEDELEELWSWPRSPPVTYQNLGASVQA